MSGAIKCDRCGECYEYGGMTVGEEYDLCDGCVADFEAWMECQPVTDAPERVTNQGEMLHDTGGSGYRYHIIRDGMMRMVVEGSDLKDTDVVESVDEPDTREKLEDDVREFSYQDPNLHTSELIITHATMDTVLGWLDRQAAITERETLHSHPICAGSDACPALNRPIGESADRETPDTAGIGASKDEIRDFDVWNVAYEIYCAGGYVDNGNEPDPPTDGIRELLDRQAAITEREVEHALMKAGRMAVEVERERIAELKAEIAELKAEIATLKEHRAANMEKLHELTDECAELRKYRDEWKGLAEKYRADSIAAQEETERYRAKLGDVLDALHEAERAAR